MVNLSIKKNERYADSTISVIGITKLYGRPQYIITQSKDQKFKFPGSNFQVPKSSEGTLEQVAEELFYRNTGLNFEKNLGLRVVVPSRSNDKRWKFNKLFFGVVSNDFEPESLKDNVYVVSPDKSEGSLISKFGKTKNKEELTWANDESIIFSKVAKDIIFNFNWDLKESNWYNQVPCLTSKVDIDPDYRPIGSGLGVSSMMLLYQPSPKESTKIILLKRKEDDYPGYAGGKIETLISRDSQNIDPVSCCVKEGQEEYGFPITPKSFIGCFLTPLDIPVSKNKEYYNSIINYSFVAEPSNPKIVEEALNNPKKFLEEKMDCYVVEDLNQHRDRILNKEIRMPDMIEIANVFYNTGPSGKLNLSHFRSSGTD